MKKKLRLTLGLILLIEVSLTGQDIQVGLMGGMSLLQGDYPSYSFKDTFRVLANPGFGLFIRRPVNNKIGIKASVYFSSFEGDDSLDPNLIGIHTPSRFKYPMIEFQLTGEFSPLQFTMANRQVDLFILGGVSAVKTTINNTDISDDCPIFNLVIPAGAGLKMQLTDRLQASLHAELCMSLSDCLDGYIGPTGVKDMYSSLKLGIAYGIVSEDQAGKGKNIGCPKF